jgi:hypothetical protein
VHLPANHHRLTLINRQWGCVQQILCETEDPDLQTWVMLLNMHIADNPQRGLTDLLGRAEGALEPKYKRQVTANAPANGGAGEHAAGPEAMEEQRQESLVRDSMEQEGEEKKSGSEGAEAVKKEFSAWKKDNTANLNVNLLAVDEDKLQAEATVGLEDNPFQIHFSAEWKPMVALPSLHSLALPCMTLLADPALCAVPALRCT